MYKIYRKEFGKKICMCSQTFEEKEKFKTICKNSDYEIYLDGKKITNKYRPKKKENEQ